MPEVVLYTKPGADDEFDKKRAFFPEFYGADPTGVSDSRSAIQQAIDAANAAGGGTVVIDGTYRTDQEIVPKSNVTLEGRGWGRSIIKPVASWASNTSVLQVGGSSGSPVENFTVRNIKFDLSAVSSSQSCKALFVTYMRNLRFENNWVYQSPTTGIGADFLDKSVIRGNRVEGCGRKAQGAEDATLGCSGIGIGTGVWGDEATLVEGNFIIDPVRYGIFVEYQSGTSSHFTSGVKIVNNHIKGAHWGIGSDGVSYMHIVGNTIEDAEVDGISITPGNAGGRSWGDLVALNTVLRSGRSALYIDHSTSGAGSPSDTGKLTIANNRFLDSVGVGVKITSSSALPSCQVNGNLIHGSGSYGLSIAGGGIIDSDIINNRITNNTGRGIHLNGTMQRVRIRGNRSGDLRSGGSRTQTHGLEVAATFTITDFEIADNDLTNNSTENLAFNGTVVTSRIKNNAGDARLEWTAVASLLNSWANVSGLPAKYRLSDDGTHVELAGRIQSGSASTIAFVLPTGYRPTTAKTLTMYSLGNGGGRGIEIGTGGDVTILAGVTQPVSLDGLRFAINV